jgi:hypothetical protein
MIGSLRLWREAKGATQWLLSLSACKPFMMESWSLVNAPECVSTAQVLPAL